MAPLHPSKSLIDALEISLGAGGVDVRAWALGFARATPAVTLVPAFGLGAVPPQVRMALGLALGLCIAPALSGQVSMDGPLPVAVVREAFRGLPLALLAALAMYVAGMAGGLIDDLRGGRETVSLPTLPEQMPPVAALFSLLSSIAFLETGGASRVARALASPQLAARFSWVGVAQAFAASVELAFAIAAPLLVSSLLLEVASALIARAATPAFVGPVLAPLKSLAVLGVLACVFERIVELLALAARVGP